MNNINTNQINKIQTTNTLKPPKYPNIFCDRCGSNYVQQKT